MERGTFVGGALALGARSLLARAALPAAAATFAAIERAGGGRLGVAALDTSTGARVGFRENERFPMCSTFKLALVAAVLAAVDAGHERLDRFVHYTRADLLDYAPVTRAHVANGGLTVEALCAAAIEVSDNTAANLLLATIGGPAGLTRYVRGLGDRVTRLDRVEPALNSAIPGDPRDTTTPAAMAGLMKRILLRSALSTASVAALDGWLAACTTGLGRLRAGLPANWSAGDKTGSGAHAATNDIAVVSPPYRAPILIAAYYVDSPAPYPRRELALAAVGRTVARAFANGRGPALRV